MPFEGWLTPSGDPLQQVIYWALVVLTALAAWFILSWLFLPFYFGLKAIIDGALNAIRGWANAITGAAMNTLAGISSAFQRLGETGRIKILLLGDIRALKKTAQTARKRVTHELKAFQRKAERALRAKGGVPRALQRLNGDIDRLSAIPQLDIESQKLVLGRAMAWIRAILLTICWLAFVILNTAMLHEFFKSMGVPALRFMGVRIDLAFGLALIYSLGESMLGFMLEMSNERARERGGFNFMALVLVPLIIVAIGFEVILYLMVGANTDIGLPPDMVASMPWLNNSLGLFGLIVGAVVTLSGYFMGELWAQVVKANGKHSLKKQARILNETLDSLPDQVRDLREKVSAAQGQANPSRIGDSELSDDSQKLTSEIKTQVDQLTAKLDETHDRKYPPITEADESEAQRYRAKAVALAGLGVAFVLGNVLQLSYALNATTIARFGFWAPPTFAFILALCMLAMGRLSLTPFVVTHARGGSDSEGRVSYTLSSHGLGAVQWASIAGACAVLVVALWAATDQFRRIDTGRIGLAIALQAATFGAGAFIEDIMRGLGFWLESAARLVLSGLLSIISIFSWLVVFVVTVLHIVIAIIAAPALWIWQQLRKGKQKRAPLQAEPANA